MQTLRTCAHTVQCTQAVDNTLCLLRRAWWSHSTPWPDASCSQDALDGMADYDAKSRPAAAIQLWRPKQRAAVCCALMLVTLAANAVALYTIYKERAPCGVVFKAASLHALRPERSSASQHTLSTDANTRPFEQPWSLATLGGQGGAAAGVGAFDDLPEVQDVSRAPRRALASFLQNDAYLAGALTLAYTLRKHGNALPLLLFTLKGGELSPAARSVAERAGWRMREWEPIAAFKPTSGTFKHQCGLPISWYCVQLVPAKLTRSTRCNSASTCVDALIRLQAAGTRSYACGTRRMSTTRSCTWTLTSCVSAASRRRWSCLAQAAPRQSTRSGRCQTTITMAQRSMLA